MRNKKVRIYVFVFGLMILLTVPFISLSICLSTANPVLEINLSKQNSKTLNCVWMNGKTLSPVPPEPLNRLKISMNLITPKSTFQSLQPQAFDPFYLDRIISKDVLMNTMIPYKEEKFAPRELFDYQVLDQFSEEEFLYFTNKLGNNPEEKFGAYFRVNPYQKKSQLIYALKDGSYPKYPSYGGYFSSSNQYCFVSGNRLFLFNPHNGEVTNEAYFPNLTSLYGTDSRDLFLFVDKEQKLNAYSILKHKIIWQNAKVKDDWWSQYPFYIKAVSYADQFVLLTNHFEQKFISLKDGSMLTNFTFDLNQYGYPAPFQEINHALWLQYYRTEEYAEHISGLMFEKITYSKEKGFRVDLFGIDYTVRDSQSGEYVNNLIPVCYSYLPHHNKVLIVFNDQEGHETQAIFELP